MLQQTDLVGFDSQHQSWFAFKQDYESSPPPCAELDYVDIQPQLGDMRYNQESHASALTIEPPQPSPILNLFNPSSLNTTAPYSQDGAAFYHPIPHGYPGIDVRRSLNSSTTTSSDMAHVHPHSHRTATLPHPGQQISARDQYAPATPSFRRPSEHPSRSPSFPGATLRNHPLSATPSPLTGFAAPAGRMDPNQYGNRAAANSVPPLGPTQTLGLLQYMDGTAADIKVDIAGTVDKGFFVSPEGEWTCYRRNYLACVCSFSLTPHYTNAPMQFTPTGSSQSLQVYGFSMCISAVVADNDQHSIDLVQHTPKRDKGPTSKPEKVPMSPKQSPASHPGLNLYGDGSTVANTRGLYADGFAGSQTNGQHLATEHTFERIQFKQATQNNGKRRAAQQYYQLTIELWADVGAQVSDQHVKVAIRKSAKMIVRGRSPGHYQNERRNSQGSGPGGSAGSFGAYTNIAGMGDFGSGAMLSGGGGGYGGSYDTRGSVYGGVRQHDMAVGAMVSSEEEKAMNHTKSYPYYPGQMYENQPDRIDMFNHRSGSESAMPHMTPDKIKNECDAGMLPRLFHPPQSRTPSQRQNGPLEDKYNPRDYYASASEIGITMV